MADKNYVLEFLKYLIPRIYTLRLSINENKIFKNEKDLIKSFFTLAIITNCIGFVHVIDSVSQNLLYSIFTISFYSVSIIFIIEVHALIEKNIKIPAPDYLIIKPAIFKRRLEKIKNFGFTFKEEELKKIYCQLTEAKFIDLKTSIESFKTVLMNDFGHNSKIYLSSSLTLGQISKILSVFQKCSKSFKPSIVFRKKLFVSYDGKEININSFNNAKNSRYKKNEEYFFNEEYELFNDFITHLIDKND